MSKLTIFRIGLAGGIYNFLALFVVSMLTKLHVNLFTKFFLVMMQKYGPIGYNLSFEGIMGTCLWVFVAGFIQFGAIALIFNVLVSKRILSNWVKESKN